MVKEDISSAIQFYEESGLGGRIMWVARDASGCLYVYTKEPKWNEGTQKWEGAFYGTFTHNAFPWVKAGMCVGFEVATIELEPIR